MIAEARRVLKDVFGFEDFRPVQAEVIQSILEGKDTLAIMPTGGGKSLCYQIPALLSDALTIVVSPLISLMKDQLDQLRQVGAPAAILNSALAPEAYRRNVESIMEGRARLLYAAPESLVKPSLLELLASVKVHCLAIDEAHCISFWGHDFRPEYRRLVDIRGRFPDAVCAAFTATATPRVREDIKKSLGFSDDREFVASFDRKNLFLEVRPKENPLGQVLGLIKKFPDDPGIVYCFTRNQVETVHRALAKEGVCSAPYHAGLSDAERERNQERFIRDDVRVIVATIAFGMGIDKPDIRFVIHYDLPKTLEHYCQEIGRAGRDGLASHCLLLLGYGDIRKVRHFVEKKENPDERRIDALHLNALVDYAETEDCRRIPLLAYFGERHDGGCGMCDNCLKEKKPAVDVTVEARKFLSCVKRTGERFGPHHVADVLRGSKAVKVTKFRHHELSTHGIGADLSKKKWLNLCRQFVNKGLLARDMRYGSLLLTRKGWEVMRGKQSVHCALEEKEAESQAGAPGPRECDRELFERLRKLRKSIADSLDAPPYVVFADRTLIEMATFFPQSMESLARIHGVGRVKLENHGPAFLEAVERYCAKRGIDDMVFSKKEPVKAKAGQAAGKRYLEVGRACADGKSIPWLMDFYGVKESTILRHLYDYLKDGNPLAPEVFDELPDVTGELKRRVTEIFDKFGVYRLKPVHDVLEGQVGFDDLHRLRLRYVAARGPGALSDILDPGKGRISTKTIVCLANSRKYSGRCVAGRELVGGKPGNWVRPVGACETGQLDLKCIMMENSGEPKLLDIMEVPLGRHEPKGCQRENFSAADGPWKKAGELTPSELGTLEERPDTLWANGYSSIAGTNDRMPEELAVDRFDRSLYLIRPERFSILVVEGVNLLKKIQAEFVYRDEMYRLIVTDPEIETRFVGRPLGRYPSAREDIYLTMSVSEPWQGYCYKLVAAVFNMEP